MWIRIRDNRLSVTIIVTVLLGIFAALSITSMRTKSPTTDEVTYIGSGYYMLKTGDFTLNSAHPILFQLLMTSPLLMMDLQLPQHEKPFFSVGKYSLLENWRYSVDFLYKANSEKVETIVFFSRAVVIFVSLILALYVFAWSKELYGVGAGLFSLFLFLFSPNVLAHSRLATTDMGVTAFTFITLFHFRKLIFAPKFRHLIFAGFFLGLTLASKVTAVLLIPVFFLYFLPVLKDTSLCHYIFHNNLSNTRPVKVISLILTLSGVFLIAWIITNLCYGFRGTFDPINTYAGTPIADLIEKPFASISSSLATFVGDMPILMPSSFVETFNFQYEHAMQGHNTFMMGMHSVKGWWYYHLFAFLIKVPVALLIFMALFALFSFTKRRVNRFTVEDYFLLVPIVVITILVSSGKIKEGFRHLLPILPFIYVAISKLVTFKFHRKRSAIFTFALLCGWYLFSSLSVHPHYLAYFNEFIGGPSNGYRYLVDSNLDWGQDLKSLKKYMDQNNIKKVKLSYFGSADPSHYGIDYEYLPSVGLRPSDPEGKWWWEEGYEEICEPTDGIIAISVTNLQGLILKNRNCFNWLKQYDPVEKIGYSIFVYDIKK